MPIADLLFRASRSVHAATVFISLNGFCMTINHWAPFALVRLPFHSIRTLGLLVGT